MVGAEYSDGCRKLIKRFRMRVDMLLQARFCFGEGGHVDGRPGDASIGQRGKVKVERAPLSTDNGVTLCVYSLVLGSDGTCQIALRMVEHDIVLEGGFNRGRTGG